MKKRYQIRFGFVLCILLLALSLTGVADRNANAAYCPTIYSCDYYCMPSYQNCLIGQLSSCPSGGVDCCDAALAFCFDCCIAN